MDRNSFIEHYEEFLDDYLHPGFNVDPNKETFTDDFGTKIYNVHLKANCAGACVIHNASEHHMRNWPLLWRDYKFERICPHDIGHTDPDHIISQKRFGRLGDAGVHGCDGCCLDQH